MAPLEITAITNFALSCELFLFAGLLLARRPQRSSAAWLWAFAMLAMGVSAFLGGVDHGFLEPDGNGSARAVVQKATWLAVGVLTVLVALTTARQFAPPRWFAWVFALAALQLAVFVVFALRSDSFSVVIVNYTPVMIALLVLSASGTRHGPGSWQIAVGMGFGFVATVARAAGVDLLSPLDRNGLYHVILMAGVAFLYRGGLRLPAALRG